MAAASGVRTYSHASPGPPPHLAKMRAHFCRQCGSPLQLILMPETVTEWRHRCSSHECGFVDYVNPKMVVGAIVEHEGQILLCRRAIEPCKGKWTVPAGFMELNESSSAGAAREIAEETGARVTIDAPYAHWDIPVIGQSYVLFRGRLAAPFTFAASEATPETLETRMFAPADIPYADIAFSSIALSLRFYTEDLLTGRWHMHHGEIEKKAGSGPNDPSTFSIKDHIVLTVEA